MNLQMPREVLLKPLQDVIGVVERRQTLPILANVHLAVRDQQLSITATDLEVELQTRINLERPVDSAEITISGRKLMDICRSLPEGAQIELVIDKDKALLRSGRSRFSLTTLPASDFPIIRDNPGSAEFTIGQKNLRALAARTHFAMAQQDVRYYLNGMLLEASEGILRTVATDGHRLALSALPAPIISNAFMQVIIPRKGVIELMHLLEDSDAEARVQVNNNHIRVIGNHFTFTSKLVDGRFPDYEKVLPRGGNKTVLVEREIFKQALTRASILSNEKFRGVRLQLRQGMLRVIANNPEHEEAEEEISLDYNQEDLEIGFNVTYILDILNTVDAPMVKMTFSDSNSSVLVEEHESANNSLFVVMPMRL